MLPVIVRNFLTLKRTKTNASFDNKYILKNQIFF